MRETLRRRVARIRQEDPFGSSHCFIGFASIALMLSNCRLSEEMKKGLHPQMQWISYVTQSGRLMHVMMTKIHHVGKVYHLKAKRQMTENLGQVAKFRQRYEKTAAPKEEP
ncbi:hypothetical protein GBA52_014738 [Prunus armeniaca]|nr:hypothetical protein GBA52_014738 [Prunus armeniaca]